VDCLIDKADADLPARLKGDPNAQVLQLARSLDDAIECVFLMEEELKELKKPTETPLFYKVIRVNVVPNIDTSSFETLTKTEWREVVHPKEECLVCTEGLLTKATSIIELECEHRFHHGCIPASICKTTGKFICVTCDPEMYKAFTQITAEEAAVTALKGVEEVDTAHETEPLCVDGVVVTQ
jgi:DNA replicative helicase MCM subunit Mcm2 (Cdc46/Mcm family)